MATKATFQDWVRAFSVEAVAELCGVTPRTVYNWIGRHTKPSHNNCLRIMGRAKHLTLADIVGGAE